MNYGVLSNIARALADKNIRLAVKSTSVINAFGKDTGELDSSALASEIGDKLISELSFYRSTINPLVTSLWNTIESSRKIYDFPSRVKDSVVEFEMPTIFNVMADSGEIKKGVNSYSPSAFTTTLVPNIDVDAMDCETLKNSLKVGVSLSPSLGMIDEIIVKYSDVELKEIIKKYCTMFIADTTNDVNGKLNYRELGMSGNYAFANMNVAMICYAYVSGLLVEPPVTNLPVSDARSVLEKVHADLKNILSYGYSFYLNSIAAKMVAYRNPVTKELYVFKPTYSEFAEQAKEDAWSAVCGLQDHIVQKVSTDFGAYNIQNVLVNESRLIKAYESQLVADQMAVQNEYIGNIKRSIISEASNLWDANIEGSDLLGYSVVPNKAEFIKAIEDILSNSKDRDILSNTYLLAVDIIGGLMFGKTSFKDFYNDTTIVNNSGLSILNLETQDTITVAAISLLSRFLINSLEEA